VTLSTCAQSQLPATRGWAYGLTFVVLRAVFDGYFRTRVSGREHVPKEGRPAILVANHTSALDVFLVGHALARPGFFLAKAEATRVPVAGWWLRSLGAIPTARDSRDTPALRATLAALRAGGLVGLAPEGTRSRDGRLGRYDPGFAWLAAKTEAAVVPCAIHGAQRLMPKGARLPRRGPLWVRFGAPLAVTEAGGRPSRQALQAVADEVRARTLTLLAELAAESGLPEPALAGEDGSA